MRKAEWYSHRYPRYSTVFCHERRSLEWQNTVEYRVNITRGEAECNISRYWMRESSQMKYPTHPEGRLRPLAAPARGMCWIFHEGWFPNPISQGNGGNIARFSASRGVYCLYSWLEVSGTWRILVFYISRAKIPPWQMKIPVFYISKAKISPWQMKIPVFFTGVKNTGIFHSKIPVFYTGVKIPPLNCWISLSSKWQISPLTKSTS